MRKVKHPFQPHYIAMGGSYGCLPDNCAVYKTPKDAVEGLNSIYELSTRQVRELRRTGSVLLTRGQGGEYYEWSECKWSECNCPEPWIHDDGFTESQWKTEHGWDDFYEGRLSWYEGASAYYIVDELTDNEACCGDGVDMFSTEAGNAIYPGTKAFDRAMNRLVKEYETFEAYFRRSNK